VNSKRVGSLKTVDASEAETSFSVLIDAAEQGRPTTITRRGVSVALIAPIADARKIYPAETPSFVDFLLSFPGGVDFECDSRAIRDMDL
jgi:prevent-host-death family protein